MSLLEDSCKSTDQDVVENDDTENADALSLSRTAFNVIHKVDGDAQNAWNLLLDKHNILSFKQINLADINEEWINSRHCSTQVDPYDWSPYLYCANTKYKKMKEEYRKDDKQIKAHILTNLPEEYKAIQMNLCMD